jgi:hypothetical protein
MAAHIAWLLNLDADLELQDPVSYRRAKLSAERIEELRSRVADLIAADDAVLDAPGRAAAATAPSTLARAFCPTPRALARIAELGLQPPPAPPLAVLRRVNDRRFCAELGHGLANACFALDMATLDRHLARFAATTFVIKRAFSFAGREQRRVYGGVLDSSTRGFCMRSFEHGEGVQVEPWVERLADFSRHGYLTRSGDVLIGETREQHCDAMGRFVRMSTEPASASEDEAASLASTLAATGEALASAGYFGPFGIDGFRYASPDGADRQTSFNPRCEINARFTMGYPRALLLQGLSADGTG